MGLDEGMLNFGPIEIILMLLCCLLVVAAVVALVVFVASRAGRKR